MEVNQKNIEILKSGGVGVFPTDTLYGLVGSVFFGKAVEKIYQLKKRSPDKPLIILITDISDLKFFGVDLTPDLEKVLQKFWPGEVSIILDCPRLPEKLQYLRPLNNTLAFRLPKQEQILELLEQTGSLVAPSANIEGEKPAETIEQAKKYFGDEVDFYKDAGKLSGEPSTLIEIKGKDVIIRRQGKIKI